MPSVLVRCDGRSFHISRSTFERYFPALFHSIWQPFYDADALAVQVRSQLGDHPSVPIRASHIYDALHDLLEELSGYESDYWSSKDGRVKDVLEKLLRKDGSGSGFDGLYRSRNRFLILCVVASCSRSDRLASELASFIGDKARRIVEKEETHLLSEWRLGVETLLGLLPSWELQRLIDKLSDVSTGLISEWDFVPYYVHYPRIHHVRRPVSPRPYGVPVEPWVWPQPQRYVPFPAPRRHRSHGDLGTMPWPGWPSPTIPYPAPHRITSGYSEDVGESQMNRAMQAVQMTDLKHRVEELCQPRRQS
jgi:hypothetical protein